MNAGILTMTDARLHYEMLGSGPPLLLVPGGNGDAGVYTAAARTLTAHFTVVTYDRRGHSRSPLTGPPGEERVERHAEDAHTLLTAIGAGPAHVFGSSSGALIAMELAARHPGRVRTVIAHEPPAVGLLPDAGRWHALFREVHDLYVREGTPRAMHRFSTETGLNAPPPDPAGLPPESRATMARVVANLEVFLGRELRSFARHTPDPAALDGITLAGGVDSRGTMPYRVAALLAERLSTPLVEFPGGHTGYLDHPRAFAETLHRTLYLRGHRPARTRPAILDA
ncbi:alpha/beta hydrolase [Actinomadura viridis]|uniref:Pimeloyl-ACP methyl ester carboxylesterase n=1 Tax=Actinomadura viridis TaxID=58110 RepID=A0A931DNB6_9ACTN|nr:alpha/beta fold hydrolase [Actinomadura viridis]MBG6091107.1 pimeloyl-ACP methyl ester carboxylesterase [Actinomadura viridis]